MNPYLFVVGCPRSGTTLLKRILGAHPEIAMAPETHWIARTFTERIGLTVDGLVTPALVDRLLEDWRFQKMRLGRDELAPLLERPDRSYASFVSGVFDLYARSQCKPLAGDKTPKYVRSIPLLHELFPGARFVHLIRDGRDVALSLMGWRRRQARFESGYAMWIEDPVSTAALWWKLRVRYGLEGGRSLPPELRHEVRYEALVADPEGEAARLSDFLGVPYDPAMVRFHEGRERHEAGLDAKHAWRPITPGLRSWRTEMTPEEVERFEAAAGDLLDELGYLRASSPGPSARRHARVAIESFERDVAFRLPARWQFTDR